MKRLLFVLAISSCAPGAPATDAGAANDAGHERVYEPIDDGAFLVGEDPRSVAVFVPGDYDPQEALPFVFLLHGYGFTGRAMDDLLDFKAFADANRFIYARPEGTVDGNGSQFWNASAACCDFDGTGVDDSAFLRSVVEAAQQIAHIDPARIWVIGHSNGGFMAHRLACDHADVFAAVISIAGATTTGACDPSEPVAVLQIHGTSDGTIAYAGDSFGPGLGYPGAVETASLWAERNDCDAATVAGGELDLETIAGAETTVQRHEGCPSGGAAELWTVAGGGHVPNGNASYLPTLLDFLQAHAR